MEVEVCLVPGLPEISFIGLPDASIRESDKKIKAAIRAQGFTFPTTQRVLVSLRPAHVRKHCPGLDLAVAYAVLVETRQLEPILPDNQEPVFYGELSLTGRVIFPQGTNVEVLPEWGVLVTGRNTPEGVGQCFVAEELARLSSLRRNEAELWQGKFVRPAPLHAAYSDFEAEQLSVIAAGEHDTLVCGAPGAGKSNLVATVGTLLEEPRKSQFFERQRYFPRERPNWRPIVRLHSTVPVPAVIGGGRPPVAGAITQAHGGILMLDEILCFKNQIQDSLREVTEMRQVTAHRVGSHELFPADLLLLATTNLCPCGWLEPTKDNKCHCPTVRRLQHVRRLSGPFVDRFEILLFASSWATKKRSISYDIILEKVRQAIEFRYERGQREPNSRLKAQDCAQRLGADVTGRETLFSDWPGRRRLAALRVARTIADIERSPEIHDRHLQKAKRICFDSYKKLEALQFGAVML